MYLFERLMKNHLAFLANTLICKPQLPGDLSRGFCWSESVRGSHHFGAFIESKGSKNHDSLSPPIITGTHRERIEALEGRFEAIEIVLAKIDRMERLMERNLRRHPWRKDSSSSTSENSDSDRSSEYIHLARDADDEEWPPRGGERWKGRPKISCPIFNGIDPVSWLSRINQYFEINEIIPREKRWNTPPISWKAKQIFGGNCWVEFIERREGRSGGETLGENC